MCVCVCVCALRQVEAWLARREVCSFHSCSGIMWSQGGGGKPGPFISFKHAANSAARGWHRD